MNISSLLRQKNGQTFNCSTLLFILLIGTTMIWQQQKKYLCHAFVHVPQNQNSYNRQSRAATDIITTTARRRRTICTNIQQQSQKRRTIIQLNLFKTLLQNQSLLQKNANHNSIENNIHQNQEYNTIRNGIQNNNNNNYNKVVPFVIERLGVRPRDEVFQNIAHMCISVFFNNGKLGRAMPPWKEVQLSYLRMIQMADLRRRRTRDGATKTNAMFVAYRVEEATSSNAALSQPLIVNLRENVYNLNSLIVNNNNNNNNNNVNEYLEQNDFVRGEILGFCEVSMIPFGLLPRNFPSQSSSDVVAYKSPLDNNDNFFDDEINNNDVINGQQMIPRKVRNYNNRDRPVLTNLSVKKEARSSGVGTKLLEACERTASIEWGKSEIVLEVEDDNIEARKWYQKRGYRVLFSDPSSKRYDVNGLYLKKVGCTRQILRKALNTFRPSQFVSSSTTTSVPGSTTETKIPLLDSFGGVFRRLRENVLQQT